MKAVLLLTTKSLYYVLILSVISCARSTVVLDSEYDPQYVSSNFTTGSDYPLIINSINDVRKDKSSLGNLGLVDVSSEDIIEWLNSAFRQRGYKFKNEIELEQPSCEVDISLKLAYIRSSSTSKTTNIVLAIKHENTEKLIYYRGSDVGMNWNSSESEIINSFSRALEDALNSMEAGLTESCLIKIVGDE